MDIEKQKTEALLAYVAAYADKTKPKEMVDLYEYLLLHKAYEVLRKENAALAERLAKAEVIP